jgi:hypothetical protein
MRKLRSSILIAGVLSSGFLFAQVPASPNMPVDEVSKLVNYSEVVDEPGMNKDTLYNRSLRWFYTFFKNPSQAIKKADAPNHTIEGGYRFTIKRPDPGVKKEPRPMVDAGLVNFKMNIMCKDAKFKYEITSISWQQTSYYPIERWMDTEAKNYNPDYALYLQQVDDYMKAMIKSLESFIETDPVKKKDDW